MARLWHGRLGPGGPEGHPERSPIVQGWVTSPDTLTGWPWRMPGPGRSGTRSRA
jgi:hypothetical protein